MSASASASAAMAASAERTPTRSHEEEYEYEEEEEDAEQVTEEDATAHPALTTLSISGCRMKTKTLSTDMAALRNLRTLQCSDCLLETIPEGIFSSLTHLSKLDLSRNPDLVFPADFDVLRLSVLDIKACTPSDEVLDTIWSMTTLKRLYVGFCGITTIPDRISELKELQVLDVCQNPFQELPSEIGELSDLQVLNCDGCVYLTTVPPELGTCSSLQRLVFQFCNSLKTIPPEIAGCDKLGLLDVSSSGLTTFPIEFGRYERSQLVITAAYLFKLEDDKMKKAMSNGHAAFAHYIRSTYRKTFAGRTVKAVGH